MVRTTLSFVLLFTVLMFLPRQADATDVRCVSDVASFKNALAAYAQPNRTQDLEIRVVQGTYAMGSQAGEVSGDGSGYKLRILGGYADGCASRTVEPTNTTYDGQDVVNAGLFLGLDGDLLIEGLTFTRTGGIYVSWDNGSDGHSAEFRYNIVKGNTKLGDGYDCVSLIADPNDSIFVHDNLFYGNGQVAHTNASPTGALSVLINDGSFAWIVNNTIADNQGIAGLSLTGNQGMHVFWVYDNIVWNNYTNDINLSEFDNTTLNLYYNTYNVLSGSVTTLNSGSNKTGAANDPQFLSPGTGDYHLLNQSTSINTGAASVPLYTYPNRDNDGGARVVGSRVDRGAFESAIDDVTNLVVSTTLDNNSNSTPTVGSIRWAIKQANANAGASTITFSTTCPTVFVLPSELPDITSDVTIDGYHTAAGADIAGASRNTDAAGWNAALCPYLNGGGSIASGFRTSGSGRLTVTGVGFSGFSDAALKLTAGSGHVVVGNQIGAVPFVAANHDGIRVTGSVSGASIGDGSPGGYNWIADNDNVGVYIDNPAGGVAVRGNLIGLGSGGSGSAGNAYGVYVFNSQKNTIAANFIDDSANAGITLSGISALYNLVQYNNIGVNGSLANEGNGGAGVLINAGAAYNTIGAGQAGTTGGNYIVDNGGPGVLITGGGVGNRVLGNQDFANAGLAIDLNAGGPSANDGLDADTGPDDMQNFPVLTGALRNGSSITIVGDLNGAASEGFRLDFYRSDACRSIGGAARGDAQFYIGRGTVTTDAGGHGHFAVLLPVGTGATGVITATATAANGDTSETGPCVTEDTLFKSGFDP